MLKKNIIVIIKILLLQLILTNFSYSKIQIKVLVNDEIITNIDIKKESEYLKILNPNLNQLEEKRIQELSKISLINEIVKKKEILKVIDITSNMNSFTNEYLENLYVKLDYKSKKEFENQLRLKNTYTLEEIKNKINIELFWNELIYKKYNNLVNINKNELVNKIEKTINKEQKEYNLSEIVFTKKKI